MRQVHHAPIYVYSSRDSSWIRLETISCYISGSVNELLDIHRSDLSWSASKKSVRQNDVCSLSRVEWIPENKFATIGAWSCYWETRRLSVVQPRTAATLVRYGESCRRYNIGPRWYVSYQNSEKDATSSQMETILQRKFLKLVEVNVP